MIDVEQYAFLNVTGLTLQKAMFLKSQRLRSRATLLFSK